VPPLVRRNSLASFPAEAKSPRRKLRLVHSFFLSQQKEIPFVGYPLCTSAHCIVLPFPIEGQAFNGGPSADWLRNDRFSTAHKHCHSEKNFSPPLPVADKGGLEFPQPHRLHKRQ